MDDAADTAQVIIRPPLAWGLAVIAGLALNWLVPLPSLPVDLPARWLGAIVFVFALALAASSLGAVRTSPPTCRPPPSSRADRTASRATPSTSASSWV